MIIRKPYAFLIKNFRVIHALLFLMLLYLSIKSFSIYSFFSSYASNHYYINTSALASNYVNYFMFACAIVAILLSMLVYYILSLKNKSRNLYLFIIIYYIILFVFFIYIFTVFQKLEEASLVVETVRAIRDICVIVVIPQVIFLFLILLRTLGFNLKQFDFKKDLEELKIEEADSEEVEVTLGNDTYKIARMFRKLLRFTKYFFEENKFFVIIIGSVLALVLSLGIFMKINVYNFSYSESENIYANNLWFNVNESYTTNTDINNLIISNNKSYILVNININNKSRMDYSVTRDTFRLEVDSELIAPTYSLKDSFIDLGEVFKPSDVKSGEIKDFIIVFEIDKQAIKKDYIFKIKNLNTSFGDIESDYKSIIITPKDLNNIVDSGTYNLPAEVDFSNTVYKNSKLIVSSYSIEEKFKENYTVCINNICNDSIYTITPSKVGKGNLSILKLQSTLNLDSSLAMSKQIISPRDFYKYVGFIRYRYQGEYYNVKMVPIENKYKIDKYSYFEVPSEVKNANKIDIILLIRGIKYTISLK